MSEARRLWRKRRRDAYIAAKYGPEFVGQRMSGRHGRHATGDRSARWSGDRRVTEQGYIAVRVAPDHPHGWGPPALKRFRYAYEHHVVMMHAIGRALRPDEVVHHRNGDRSDNRIENLELTTRSAHASDHAAHPGARDVSGRFAPGACRSGDSDERTEGSR